MVQFIADDQVTRFAQRWEDRFVGVPATCEGVRGLASVELCDLRLKRFVTLKRAADESNARGAGAVATQSFDARLNHLGVIGKTHVVVGAEARHFAVTTEFHRGAHRALNRLQVLQLPRILERGENLLRAALKRAVGDGGHSGEFTSSARHPCP